MMCETSKPFEGHLVHVRLRPLWAYIEGIREFGAFFCETTFDKEDLVERVRLVTHELLENAVKYSRTEWSEIEFSIRAERDTFQISVTNYATKESADCLEQDLDFVLSEAAESSYRSAIKRAAGGPQGQSKLGLARIRYEGQVDLSIRRDDQGMVCVTAKGNL